MKTIEINLYKFAELSDEAQQTAIEKLSDINVDYNWWDSTYEDAKNVGIVITSFDDYNCSGDVMDTEQTAHDITNQHGKSCDTYKTAFSYLLERDEVIANWPKDGLGEFENEDELDAKLDDMGEDFEKAILEDYRIMLRKESEYLQSKEAIISTIEANDYDFTEDGEMY